MQTLPLVLLRCGQPLSRFLKLLGLLAGGFLLLAFPLEASITNEGNQSVQLVFKKKNGLTASAVLNPNQLLIPPSDTVSITVKPLGPTRGDEEVLIKVVQPDGETSEIKTYGSTVTVGEEFEEELVDEKPTIQNLSNNTVIALIEEKKRRLRRRLYPGETVVLPDNAVAVSLRADGKIWGDEKIEAKVTLTDGSSETISSFGSKIKLDAEDATEDYQVPSFIGSSPTPEPAA
ncbi:MAG: hypothetical protein ACOY3K_04935 [Candidatus Omnitrophota bacterium]